MFEKGRFLLNATEFFEMILSQECRAHATQQLDIALASLRDPGPDDELEEDDMGRCRDIAVWPGEISESNPP